MKRKEVPQTGGEEILRRGKKKSPSPAQPHRKAKSKRRQPLSPPTSSSPGPPAGPAAPWGPESPGRGLAELCTSSQAESNMQSGLCPAEDRKKERMQQNFLPPPAHPGLPGKELHPQTNQPAPFRRGLSPTRVLPGGTPPSAGGGGGQSTTRELPELP